MSDAGWYPDAADPLITRYWDGTEWITERVWDGWVWVEPSEPLTAPPDAPTAELAQSTVLQVVPEAGPEPETASEPATSARAYPTVAAAEAADARETYVILGIAIAAFLLLVVVAWFAFGGGGESSAPTLHPHATTAGAPVRL